MVYLGLKSKHLWLTLTVQISLLTLFLTACGQDSTPQYTAEILVKVTPSATPSLPASTAAVNTPTIGSTTIAAFTNTIPAYTSTVETIVLPTSTTATKLTATPTLFVPTATAIAATATSAPPPTLAPTTAAAFSPTGKIVFSDYKGNIALINPDGNGKKTIGRGSNPLFSPDGQRVAYIEELPATQNTYYGGDRIISVNLDGSGRQEMCRSKPNYGFHLLRWSPRGRFIALLELPQATEPGPTDVSMCSTANFKLNGPLNMRQGTVKNIYDWTVDGENALWLNQETGSDNYALYYGDPDKFGEGAVKLTSRQYLVATGMAGDPRRLYYDAKFSPDGKTIAVIGEKIFFLSVPRQKSPLEGKVLDGFETFRDVAWSPDGRALAICTAEGSSSSITKYFLKVVEVGPTQLPGKVITVDTDVAYFDWSRQ